MPIIKKQHFYAIYKLPYNLSKRFFQHLKYYGSVAFFIIVIGMLLSALLGGIGILVFRFVLFQEISWTNWAKWIISLICGAVCYVIVLALYDYWKHIRK